MGPKPFRAIAGIAATFIALSLTACGGASEADSRSTEPAESAPVSSAPASTAPASSAPASSAPAEEDSSEGDSGSKPSKQEVTDGLVIFYQESQGLSKKKAQGFADCMVKETYDEASTELLIMMRDGSPDPAKMSADDMQLISEAGLACAPEIE